MQTLKLFLTLTNIISISKKIGDFLKVHKLLVQQITDKHLKIEVFKARQYWLENESTAILRTDGNRLPVDTA
jgi:hypothetical protein